MASGSLHSLWTHQQGRLQVAGLHEGAIIFHSSLYQIINSDYNQRVNALFDQFLPWIIELCASFGQHRQSSHQRIGFFVEIQMPVEWSPLQDQPGTWAGILLLLRRCQPLRCFYISSLQLQWWRQGWINHQRQPEGRPDQQQSGLILPSTPSVSSRHLPDSSPPDLGSCWCAAGIPGPPQCWGCIQIKNRLLPSKFACNRL